MNERAIFIEALDKTGGMRAAFFVRFLQQFRQIMRPKDFALLTRGVNRDLSISHPRRFHPGIDDCRRLPGR
jgi:hypothetical protein